MAELLVKFKPLLDRWKKVARPELTARQYAVRLPVEDAARLRALSELFPGQDVEEIITDLLHAGLDEIEAAMPHRAVAQIQERTAKRPAKMNYFGCASGRSRLTASIPASDTHRMTTAKTVRISYWWRASLMEWAPVV
jgi:hypothetical protein